MTDVQGRYGAGTLFSIDTTGNDFTLLHQFGHGSDGGNQGDNEAELLLIGGKLYGATPVSTPPHSGTIYSIDTNGNGYTIVNYIQGTNTSLGFGPEGSLALVGNKFYGFCYQGTAGDGVVFSIDTNGAAYDTVMSFYGSNGSQPRGHITLMGSKIFGMTYFGGANTDGVLFSIDTGSSGLHSFQDLFDFSSDSGYNPQGSLLLSSGVLYGTTSDGGEYGFGTLFRYGAGSANGINQINSERKFISVYPNPNNGQFTFNFNTPVTGSVEIYDLMGRKVYQETVQSEKTEMNLNGQPDGMYFYRVISNSGSLIGEGKVIIQK